MQRIEPIFVDIPFQQRKIDDPDEFKLAGIAQARVFAKFDTQRCQDFIHNRGLVGHHQNQVVIFGLEAIDQLFVLFRGKELGNIALETGRAGGFIGGNFEPGQPLGTEFCDKLGQADFDVAAGVFCTAGHT